MRVDLLITADILAVANKAGAILDYDTGGASTFSQGYGAEGATTPSHYFASTLLNDQYLPAFESAEAMYDQLNALATLKGAELMTLEECQALHAGLTMAPAIDLAAEGLYPIAADEAQ